MLANPRQAENFWAEMRSTAYLFNKSKLTTERQTHTLQEELGYILGNSILNYPKTLTDYGIGPNTSYENKKRLLGLDKTPCNTEFNANEIRFIHAMSVKQNLSQKRNWAWRITQEAEQKQQFGWYPFFVTLTVDPKMTDPRQLWEEGRELRKYIRRLANISAKLQGHPPPHIKNKEFGYRPESDYVTYAGVVEHGKSQEHHHGHFMIWMKNIPSEWKVDPNNGKLPEHRTERECKPMRYLWPWAIASQKPSLYFRTKGDIWSTLGHVNPVDKKTGKTIKINQVQAVGNYITKYMQKGTKLWHHRMKCTRNLGLQKIKAIINHLPERNLLPLTWRPHDSNHHHLVSSIHSVPIGIVKSLAKQKLFSVKWANNQLDLTELMKTNYEHYTKMLKSVKDGARPDRMPSAEFYDWVQQFLPEQEGYSKEKIIESHQLLSRHFPRKSHKISPIVFGANEIGFTLSV